MRKWKRLYDKYKKSNSSVDFKNYQHVRNKFINEIRKSRKAEVENLAKNLEDNTTLYKSKRLMEDIKVF